MRLLTNAQFLEYRCEHCGFGWCELMELTRFGGRVVV